VRLAIAVPRTIWLAVVWYLAVTGAFQVIPGARLPHLPIFLPVLIAFPVLLLSRSVAALLDAAPASWLIALQVYRVFGGVFLVNWLNGNVAAVFAWPAGIGDMATGIAALPVALAVASGTVSGRRAGLRWDVVCLFDFAVAITMGFLTSPGPFQHFGFHGDDPCFCGAKLHPSACVVEPAAEEKKGSHRAVHPPGWCHQKELCPSLGRVLVGSKA
jgi:hypothetical protein